ncbi:MAG: tRNA (adenosine(37)-N6)-threonylcarbamoyltransferase complex ATPase subunit type 1 TsaE [Bdellovibrionales bacterium]|nr:tRNA (adenosine(37)-N6)-threonylcarbamoyltransferase complex ATPase subunit type 1 TsaE [Bdellovibrionales bacterium]
MKSICIEKKLRLQDMNVFSKELRSLFKTPQVLLLEGPPGVGKTTLTHFLLNEDMSLKNRGKEDKVSSPAFSIQNHYITDYGFVRHIDLYRIKDDDDLESTGFWDIFSEPENTYLIIIEWANRLNSFCFPVGWHYIKVAFTFNSQQDTRNVFVTSGNLP